MSARRGGAIAPPRPSHNLFFPDAVTQCHNIILKFTRVVGNEMKRKMLGFNVQLKAD